MFHYSIVLFHNECNPSSFSLIAQINSHLPKKPGTITLFCGWKWKSLQETHPTPLTVFPLGHNQHWSSLVLLFKNFTFHTMIDETEDLYLLPLAFLLAPALNFFLFSLPHAKLQVSLQKKKYCYWRYWVDVTSFYSAWHQGRQNTILIISKK